MANTLQVKRRIGGAFAAPAALAEGELAFNDAAQNALGAPDGALWIGAGGPAVDLLVGAARQVEMTGTQTGIVGQKNFETLSFGTLATNNLLPLTRGLAGQALIADGLGAMSWANIGAISEEAVDLPGAIAINTEFDAAGITVTTSEIVVVRHQGSVYLYTGAAGAPVLRPG